ncbi:MAG TPA: hypothetical protein VGM07_19315 [Stellaceae bacterium]
MTWLAPALYPNAANDRRLPALLPTQTALRPAARHVATPIAGAAFHLLFIGLTLGVTIAIFFGSGFVLLGQAPMASAPGLPAAGKPIPPVIGPATGRGPAALIARGDGFLGAGDIASARRLYEQAANAGDAEGALRMGATFDLHFLRGRGLPIAAGDPANALSWYGRAFGLGLDHGQFH